MGEGGLDCGLRKSFQFRGWEMMCRFLEVTLDMLMFKEGSLEGWELGESEAAGETGW